MGDYFHEEKSKFSQSAPFCRAASSFQLATDPADTNGDYFRQGDWHDVLLLPDNAMDVLFQTDYYTGKQVIHCHILEHEDEGMMLVTQVTLTLSLSLTLP